MITYNGQAYELWVDGRELTNGDVTVVHSENGAWWFEVKRAPGSTEPVVRMGLGVPTHEDESRRADLERAWGRR